MYPHRILLRGPWDCEPLARLEDRADEPLPPPRRANVPCRWEEIGLLNFCGRVRFRRRFGYPGRIDTHERVWLVLEGITCSTEIRLNDRLLGQGDHSFEFDATDLLQARNELIVDVDATGERGLLWSESALEVRCTAFLRNVRRNAVRSGEGVHLRVTGEVVGRAERTLELYVVIGRSVAGYQVVTADVKGQPFEIIVPEATWQPGERLPVKVDLVNGASVWYTSVGEGPFEPSSAADG